MPVGFSRGGVMIGAACAAVLRAGVFAGAVFLFFCGALRSAGGDVLFYRSEDAGAVRFLQFATFGPSARDVAEFRTKGRELWLDEQFALEPEFHLPLLREVEAALGEDERLQPIQKQHVWWERALGARDQLRQRMAYALSQILVISDSDANLRGRPASMTHFYDTLLEHAFGNYRDLLVDVSLHPAMGLFLSHLYNEKASADGLRLPDENYARELMQLFTIGLYELEPDGQPVLREGSRVPTYDNEDIMELARVFTGLGLEGNGRWRNMRGDFTAPMAAFPEKHDDGEKVILKRVRLPAGQGVYADVEAAVDVLFEHNNTPPFVSRLLIQRLTATNPSPDYVRRVAEVFVDNGSGVRGDLAAVLRAILTDLDLERVADGHDAGKLREPYLRLVALLRAFGASAGEERVRLQRLDDRVGQEPYSAPSVFNFYLPDYAPPGAVDEAGLVAPELEITNSITSLTLPNVMREAVFRGALGRRENALRLDLEPYKKFAAEPARLVEVMDVLLASGQLSEGSRQIILKAVSGIAEGSPMQRVRMAAYLVAISPDAALVR